jgi:hypothetical protein
MSKPRALKDRTGDNRARKNRILIMAVETRSGGSINLEIKATTDLTLDSDRN